MKAWSRVIERVSDLGAVVVMIIALYVLVDVIGRKVAKSPLPGAYAYVEVALVMVICFSWALVEYRKRQVRVDVFSSRLRGRLMHLSRATSALLALVFFGLITWQTWSDWFYALRINELGYEVKIPMVIPRGALLLGAGLISIELLRSFIVSVWSLFDTR